VASFSRVISVALSRAVVLVIAAAAAVTVPPLAQVVDPIISVPIAAVALLITRALVPRSLLLAILTCLMIALIAPVIRDALATLR
jgi:hypothetical protein